MHLKFNSPLVLSIGAFAMLATSVSAVSATRNNAKNVQPATTIAQRTCPSNSSVVNRRFDTANHYVYICSGDSSNTNGYYVGINKNGRGRITVPLSSSSEETYTARNANTSYRVTPFALTVTQNNRQLLNERVTNVSWGENEWSNFPNFCRDGESMFVSAETRGFWVNICGGDAPYTYVGVSKTDGKSIRLPLRNHDPRGDSFEAFNGNVSYLLIRGTPKGDFLTVTQGTRELFREPIEHWY